MYSDYHLHTNFSGDSDAPMENMIEKGIEMGLKIMCFTEHYDLDYPEIGINFEVNTREYLCKFLKLKEQYKEQITLYFGIELGLQPHLAEAYHNYLREYPFDFVIGSSHLVNHMDPYFPDLFQNRDEKAAYYDYFQTSLDNVSAFSEMDIYGHLDYIVRYGPNKNRDYNYHKYREIIDELLKALVEKGIGLECNTAGFKYGLGHPHPTEEILVRYRELGGEIITLGSDAHSPEHIAFAFEKGAEILKNCGYHYYTVFEKREPKFIKLE